MPTHIATTATIHRLSVEDVLAMVEAEILDERARVELVEGVLVTMNPIGAEHGDTVATLAEHLTLAVAGRLRVRVQDMLKVSDDEYVLPDVAVIAPIARAAWPTTALLVVEVAETSQLRDREKAALYASIGVAEYWIVDLAARLVTVHREPSGLIGRAPGRSAFYGSVLEHRDGAVAPAIEGVPPVALTPCSGASALRVGSRAPARRCRPHARLGRSVRERPGFTRAYAGNPSGGPDRPNEESTP